MSARYTHDGEPANLEAAAKDAITWLKWLMAQRASVQDMGIQNTERLAAMIGKLREFSPTTPDEWDVYPVEVAP